MRTCLPLKTMEKAASQILCTLARDQVLLSSVGLTCEQTCQGFHCMGRKGNSSVNKEGKGELLCGILEKAVACKPLLFPAMNGKSRSLEGNLKGKNTGFGVH